LSEQRISPLNRRLAERDLAANALGIVLVEAQAGYARAELKLEPHHGNAHGMCHGGVIFTLADSTFGHACNGHDRKTVASGADIDFLRPGQIGTTLTAEAVETAISGRTGIYDITVRDADNAVVAVMRGRSRVIGASVSPD
jgi:acyl-CoA thioesterase